MKILYSLKLLLPAIIPSWNFFDVITPSPRIQFSLFNLNSSTEQIWNEFRPLPTHLSFKKMLQRMLWNSRWNESLYLVSCAEKIVGESSQQIIQHSENEILKRIENDLLHINKKIDILAATHLQFRLMFVQRQGEELQQDVAFVSRTQALPVVTKI